MKRKKWRNVKNKRNVERHSAKYNRLVSYNGIALRVREMKRA